jgi:hypothetical protein
MDRVFLISQWSHPHRKIKPRICKREGRNKRIRMDHVIDQADKYKEQVPREHHTVRGVVSFLYIQNIFLLDMQIRFI